MDFQLFSPSRAVQLCVVEPVYSCIEFGNDLGVVVLSSVKWCKIFRYNQFKRLKCIM